MSETQPKQLRVVVHDTRHSGQVGGTYVREVFNDTMSPLCPLRRYSETNDGKHIYFRATLGGNPHFENNEYSDGSETRIYALRPDGEGKRYLQEVRTLSTTAGTTRTFFRHDGSLQATQTIPPDGHYVVKLYNEESQLVETRTPSTDYSLESITTYGKDGEKSKIEPRRDIEALLSPKN